MAASNTDGRVARKLHLFGIQYTAERTVYSPGDVITGEIVMELSDATNIQEISIRLQGVGSVQWMGGCSLDCREILSIRTHNKESETYLDQRLSLFGNDKNGTDAADTVSELRRGTHAFFFEFTVPEKKLPYSYEGRYGYVRYFLTATIHKPWKHNHVTKRAFTLLGEPLDFNDVSEAKNPITTKKSATPGMYPRCVAGKVNLSVTLPRSAYCCGESIIIDATIDNLSKRRIETTTASLIQYTTYNTARSSKTVAEIVKVVEGDGVEPDASLTWTSGILDIPALPPTELRYCSVIDLQYALKFSAIFQKGPRDTVSVTIPLKLGNVPIKAPKSSEESSSMSTKPTGPSYGACVKGSRDIRDDNDNNFVMGHLSFTPTYIVHKDIKQFNSDTHGEADGIQAQTVI